MPGPFVTPPAQRHLFHSNSAFYMTPPARRPDMGASHVTVTSRTASPLPGGRFGSLMSMQSGGAATHGAPHQVAALPHPVLHGSPQWRSSPKPHSSPKMKLRCASFISSDRGPDSKQSTNANSVRSHVVTQSKWTSRFLLVVVAGPACLLSLCPVVANHLSSLFLTPQIHEEHLPQGG